MVFNIISQISDFFQPYNIGKNTFWHCGGCLNKRAARLRFAVQAPAITTTEQGGTQSARERAFAAESLGDLPLSPVRQYLSCNANVYRRYPYIGVFSLFSIQFNAPINISPDDESRRGFSLCSKIIKLSYKVPFRANLAKHQFEVEIYL